MSTRLSKDAALYGSAILRRYRRMRPDPIRALHPQVRARYIASLYADRKGLTGKDRDDYINKQEARVMRANNRIPGDDNED